MKTIAEELASRAEAVRNCVRSNNKEWERRHRDVVISLMKDTAPSGSGFDNGTRFDIEASGFEKLVFSTSYHHMDDHGSYDGWSDHPVTARPTFIGVSVRVGGRDRNGFKDYAGDVFREWLNSPVPEPALVPADGVVDA